MSSGDGAFSPSAWTSGAPRSASSSSVCGTYHESWRNSTAKRTPDGISPRKPASRSSSRRNDGGVWKRIGPRRAPRSPAPARNCGIVSAGFRSLSKCVMRCDAFSAKTKPGAVCASHFAHVSTVGKWLNV